MHCVSDIGMVVVGSFIIEDGFVVANSVIGTSIIAASIAVFPPLSP